MKKKCAALFCVAIMGFLIHSCDEPILPKNVEVKGTMTIPAKIGATDLSSVFIGMLGDVFGGAAEGAAIYNVNFDGQGVQTFCIYFPIEITEDLNPDHFLQTINAQMNYGISMEPRKIDRVEAMYLPPEYMDDSFSDISDFIDIKIPPINLDSLARYVRSISFDECDDADLDEEGNVKSGIGIDFYFYDIEDDLVVLTLRCDKLEINETKPLRKGHNVFGNGVACEMVFEPGVPFVFDFDIDVKFASDADIDIKYETIPGMDIKIPQPYPFYIEGEVRFFQKWTEAKIDLKNALKESEGGEEFTGAFPDAPLDLSALGEYFGGEFDFNGLEVKMYMDGPFVDIINDLGPRFLFEAAWGSAEEPGRERESVYDNNLIIDQEPITLGNYLDDTETYYREDHLPHWEAGAEMHINTAVFSHIFRTMPQDLLFNYEIIIDDLLTIHSDAFTNMLDSSGEGSKINAALMIMLPLSLKVDEGDAWINFPEMFPAGKDLFGRDSAGSLIDGVDISYIKLSIGFVDSFFEGGNLAVGYYYDEENEKKVFPHGGIILDGKRITLDIRSEEFSNYLIMPEVKLLFTPHAEINIPKHLGLTDIKIEFKTSVDIGSIFGGGSSKEESEE